MWGRPIWAQEEELIGPFLCVAIGLPHISLPISVFRQRYEPFYTRE